MQQICALLNEYGQISKRNANNKNNNNNNAESEGKKKERIKRVIEWCTGLKGSAQILR